MSVGIKNQIGRKKLAGFAAAIAMTAITVTGVAPTLAGAQVAPPSAKVRETPRDVVSVSNDGNMVLFKKDGQLKLRNLDAKKSTDLGAMPNQAALSGDGTVVYTATASTTTYDIRRFTKASGWTSIGSLPIRMTADDAVINVNLDGSNAIYASKSAGYNRYVAVLSEKRVVDKSTSFCARNDWCTISADIVDNLVTATVYGEFSGPKTVWLDLKNDTRGIDIAPFCHQTWVSGNTAVCADDHSVTTINLRTYVTRTQPIATTNYVRIEAVSDNGQYVTASVDFSPESTLIRIDMKTGVVTKLLTGVYLLTGPSANGRAFSLWQIEPKSGNLRNVTVAH